MLVSRDVWLRVREQSPLAHQMTNYVAAYFQADVTLAVGARPVMTYWDEETAEICANADGLLINTGTPEAASLRGKEAALIVCKCASVLDAVGCGASRARMKWANRFMSMHRFSCIKGNGAEIRALATGEARQSGVDGGGLPLEENIANTRRLASERGCVVVCSGPVDVICAHERVWIMEGGNPMLSGITGAGCALGSAICAAIAASDPLSGACAALSLFAAASDACPQSGPGTFRAAFLDALYDMTKNGYPMRAVRKVD